MKNDEPMETLGPRQDRCPECAKPLARKTLHVVATDCWKCGGPMKVALLDFEGVPQAMEQFCKDDMALARDLGVVLTEHYSYTSGEGCVANACPSCGTFVGNYYLPDYWELITEETAYDSAMMCVECNKHYG